MKKEYIHDEIDREERFVAGYYILEDEKRLNYQGKEFMYVVARAEIDNSWCGSGGCRYAIVPGFLIQWKNRTNESGKIVSDVETISDKESKKDIIALLNEKEIINQVQFW